jgi:hypothetical protein
MRILTIATLVLALSHSFEAEAAFSVHRLPSPRLISGHLIVGRSACLGSTWLLTEEPTLVRISAGGRSIALTPVAGFETADRPWGLACLPDASLWTLAAPKVLARLSLNAGVAERLGLPSAHVALFNSGDQLLVQRAQARPGESVLTATPPHALSNGRPWPGLTTRSARTARDQLTRNLLNCGIGANDFTPCWFIDDSTVTISNGSASETLAIDAQLGLFSTYDPATPIWDVALAAHSRAWILLSSRTRVQDRRTGSRLIRTNRRGTDRSHVDLHTPIRLIVWAEENACVLLTSGGELLEVTGS